MLGPCLRGGLNFKGSRILSPKLIASGARHASRRTLFSSHSLQRGSSCSARLTVVFPLEVGEGFLKSDEREWEKNLLLAFAEKSNFRKRA